MKKHYQIAIVKKRVKKTARAMSVGAHASLKYATEICNQIRGKPVSKVRAFLKRVLDKKDFLPLNRYNKKVAHRKGNAQHKVKSGRYPVTTVKSFLKLLESAVSNADYKGLDSEKLLVVHAFASQAFGRPSFQSQGRIGGKRRERKTCHIEIILAETA